MAQLVARILCVLVGIVRTEPLSPLFQKRFDLSPVQAQKRPDVPSVDRADAAKPRQAGSPCQVPQECLRVVILVMRQGDLRPPALCADLLKGFPPDISAALLKRLFPFFGN